MLNNLETVKTIQQLIKERELLLDQQKQIIDNLISLQKRNDKNEYL